MEIARFIFEIITAIALIATFIVILYYTIQVKRSVDEMQKQRADFFRPIVACEEVCPDPAEMQVKVKGILNFGRGPAFNVRMWIEDAKYEMRTEEFKVISERTPGFDALLTAERYKPGEPFEFKEGVKSGALIFRYENIEKWLMSTRVDFWKWKGEWKSEILYAGKWL